MVSRPPLRAIVLAALALLAAVAPAPAGELPGHVRVAAARMEITDSVATNLERILRGMAGAKEAGARLAVFPQAALSGFGEAALSKLDAGPLQSAMDEIAAAADKLDLYVIYGSATKTEGDRPRNSAIVLGPDGKEVSRYHELAPEACFEPGEELAFFEIDGVPCTLAIGRDERRPELVRLPVLRGALVCFFLSHEPNAPEGGLEKRGARRARVEARAAENSIWAVEAGGFGPPPERADPGSLCEALVVDPEGAAVKEAAGPKEAMVVAEIEPAAASRARALESLSIGPLRGWWEAGVERVNAPAGGTRPITGAPPASRTKLRLALLKAVPVKWDLEANFRVFLELLEQAGRERAELFVTPECWLDGYAAAAPESTPEKLRAVAQELAASDYLKRVAAEAERRSIFIAFGFTSLEGGKLYNAAGLWGPDGKRIGVYHKTHLQQHDLQFSPGDSLPVWPTAWGPIGIMICADRRWPETARTLRLKGARLLLNPSYGMCHEANEWWMRMRGYENQCFIAFAHPKVAFVVDPKGDLEGKIDGDSPGVLLRDIDLTRASDDNHLRDRRPELYDAITAPRKVKTPTD